MDQSSNDLTHFVDRVFRMIEDGIGALPDARPMVDAVARHLAAQPPAFTTQHAGRLPVCSDLGQALQAARAHGANALAVADAFAVREPGLEWRTRAGAAEQGDAFLHGHANALIIGHANYAMAEKVTLGVSLLAPGVTYPDHAHPPEELYIVLSPGKWRQNRGAWHRREAGELVHNSPGINHGMMAEDAPLLALWMLWNRT